jgi:hypothetical protein
LASRSNGSTSKTYPWSFWKAPPARCSVSSQVSQVSHGVMPPAQLLCVPATLTYSRMRLPSLSTSMFVVPPFAPGS